MTFSIIPEFTNLTETLQLVTEYGANLEYNDFWHPEVYEHPEEIDRRIGVYKDLPINQAACTLHGAFLGVDITAGDSVMRTRSRELCEQSLELARRLGVKGVVFHTGLIGTLTLESYVGHWVSESSIFWQEQCSTYPDLTIYLENTFEQSPDVFVRLMERMHNTANFKLCFDYAHAILTPTPIEEWCRKLAPYIGHLHCNDNDLRNDLHQALGQGCIDFTECKQLLQHYHIDTSMLLEVSGCNKARISLDYVGKHWRERHEEG